MHDTPYRNAALSVCIMFLGLVAGKEAHAQHLVVGYFDRNEVVRIESTTVRYDSVLVVNHGTLIIRHARFTADRALIVAGSGSLSVAQSAFTVNGNSIFAQNGSAVLKDSLAFHGNLWSLDSASLRIDGATVQIPMAYVGQYQLYGNGDSRITISNSSVDMDQGKFSGGFTGNAVFNQVHATYRSAMGVAMTLNVSGNAVFTMDSCDCIPELVIRDTAGVEITNSTGAVLWHGFTEDATADITFPPVDTASGYASRVVDYSFSSDLPGVSGIHYTIDVRNTGAVYWALLPDPGSEVTIGNSTIAACGFTFTGNTEDTIIGFVNDSLYAAYTAPLTDRSFSLANSVVRAWNFYPMDSTGMVIRNCVFGEALTFNDAELYVENSICDGTGGYFGAQQNSSIRVRNSIIYRKGGAGPDILVNIDDTRMLLEESVVIGTVSLSQNTTLISSNAVYSSRPAVYDAACFFEASLDTFTTTHIDSGLAVTGTLRETKGPQCIGGISGYRLEYTGPGGNVRQLLLDTAFTGNMENTALYHWDTSALTDGEYRLFLTTRIGGDSAVTTERDVLFTGNGAIKNISRDSESHVFTESHRNPFSPPVSMVYLVPENGDILLMVCDLQGRVVRTLVHENKQAGSYSVAWDGRDNNGNRMQNEVYYYLLKSGGKCHRSKPVVMVK